MSFDVVLDGESFLSSSLHVMIMFRMRVGDDHSLSSPLPLSQLKGERVVDQPNKHNQGQVTPMT